MNAVSIAENRPAYRAIRGPEKGITLEVTYEGEESVDFFVPLINHLFTIFFDCFRRLSPRLRLLLFIIPSIYFFLHLLDEFLYHGWDNRPALNAKTWMQDK